MGKLTMGKLTVGKLTVGKLTVGVDVIPPQKGNINDSQKGNNVETRITREREGLF